MISKERKHELAIGIGAQRANDALTNTTAGTVYQRIATLDDIAPLPEHEKQQLAVDITNLICSGRAIFERPQDFVGKEHGELVDVPDEDLER